MSSPDSIPAEHLLRAEVFAKLGIPLAREKTARPISNIRGYHSKHTARTLDTMFILVFFGFLRCSEISTTSSFNPSVHPTISDLFRYRLAPAYHFPIPFEDVYGVVKYFLDVDVLRSYHINPERIAVSGDSAGGNLAAAVAQQLQQDSRNNVHLKVQALIYPVLQALDLNTPSYQQNQHMPILSRTLMIRFWSEYFTSDKSFFRAMMTNTHNNPESAALLKFVNWSSYLPDSFRQTYNYSAPPVAIGKNPVHSFASYRWLIDPRASPLLVPDTTLRLLPKTYVLTCEYDVLRDDGLMYVMRLRNAGVDVTHEHYPGGFHGALMFTVWPSDFEIGRRMIDNYVTWLKQNL
ncbi:arylacetamide deacetylase-like [Triplophysa rosa]|uniref:arylacetamide deacetylase-like n=1 Tax=Triplophysa rosa TaxID=992332 RepID=UPI002545E33C|nr:arylacetamide deacetylase-like [Triplophysa rosa]